MEECKLDKLLFAFKILDHPAVKLYYTNKLRYVPVFKFVVFGNEVLNKINEPKRF
jgi:hypothetical protein